MIKNATADELVVALTNHLEVTKEQVKQVEEIFSSINEKAKTKKCDAMEGLIKETRNILENTTEGMVRDAGIISATQKVEHYEIASYGTLYSFARTLGEDNAAAMLQEILDQEKEADAKLSEIAESFVNNEAVGIED